MTNDKKHNKIVDSKINVTSKTKITPDILPDVINTIKSGDYFFSEIAEQFSVSRGTISRIAKKHGLSSTKPMGLIDDKMKLEILNLAKTTNLRFDEIGEKFNVSHTTVGGIARNSGVRRVDITRRRKRHVIFGVDWVKFKSSEYEQKAKEIVSQIISDTEKEENTDRERAALIQARIEAKKAKALARKNNKR